MTNWTYLIRSRDATHGLDMSDKVRARDVVTCHSTTNGLYSTHQFKLGALEGIRASLDAV